MKEIRLEATTASLKPLFEFIKSELSECGCSGRDIRTVKLCVEEVFVNIANYAYQPETGEVLVGFDAPGKYQDSIRVNISFIDNGRPFNPLEEEDPDLDADLEERTIGGLGIFLVKSKMDDVNYEYMNGQNILTIIKDLKPASCQKED